MTAVKCNIQDCSNRGSKLCQAAMISLDWYEGTCKQYEPINVTMRKTHSLDNRAKLK
jgi:hypothetical protein